MNTTGNCGGKPFSCVSLSELPVFGNIKMLSCISLAGNKEETNQAK
jgi:hypothetical protein